MFRFRKDLLSLISHSVYEVIGGIRYIALAGCDTGRHIFCSFVQIQIGRLLPKQTQFHNKWHFGSIAAERNGTRRGERKSG